jgi:hypothetical protein
MLDDVMRFGGNSSTAPLRDVLVRRPRDAFGSAFDDPALGFRHPVDLVAAQREHDAFTDLLIRLGVRVHELPDEPDPAELVYAYDPLMITDAGAGDPLRGPALPDVHAVAPHRRLTASRARTSARVTRIGIT